MGIVDIALVKSHLRLDSDAPDTDLVLAYLDAAEEAAIEYLNRNVYKTPQDVTDAENRGEDRPMLVNPSFVAAVLQAVGQMYFDREDEAAAQNRFPQASRRLLDPFRIGQGV